MQLTAVFPDGTWIRGKEHKHWYDEPTIRTRTLIVEDSTDKELIGRKVVVVTYQVKYFVLAH